MTMLDAIRRDAPGLLLNNGTCRFCGNNTARVGDLCCACAEDPEAREQYAAQCAREELQSEE